MKIVSTQYSLIYKSFEIYLSGCKANPKCKNCCNPELWNFNIGKEYNQYIFEEYYNKIKRFDSLIDNIFILGGDPIDQNKEELIVLLFDFKKTQKPIWIFTRYDLKNIDKNILELSDYMKCGKYQENLLCKNNIQYGIKLATSNQRIYKKGIDY
jgi:anaerobic ribonucleoside-triphosphate reductase activating protein